ncbi:MCE family protein [Prauserella muralis]|uniref:ABC transporter substrate-binding protein n=1 Tax=Prauserella muralis TaxID=588067 RepID=A0A2V4B9X9_9PSEU|nr:MCE family protein [Prauserella muralis]PXY32164.1 ABC transporter substrate-binding protein [Prauserella muralis]TWE24182.1 virulence factor Mce-like protein [Prauserella muralis]
MKAAMVTLRRRLLGLLLIALLVGGVALSVAIYNKSFSTFVTVKLQADKIGNQLTENSDVKVRGLIVGSVADITPTETGAELTLHLRPDQADLVPSNVSARFLPKTLFGERFVSLEIPDDPSPQSLRNGDVIPQDRTSSAIELEQALESLMPVLQAVQPQKLSSTLTAISTALQGRGEPLGQTLSELGDYLGRLNPHLPDLQENLRQLATFSDNLTAAAPDLVRTLDNLTTTSRTIVEQRQNLQTLYGSMTNVSVNLQSFLEANASNIISLGETARPTAELLARYAPEYPCFLGQMAELLPRIDRAFGKGTSKPGLHATIEITTNRGPYKPGQDEPEYNDKRGPRCYDMEQYPDPFPQHPPDGPLRDGSTSPPPARSQNDGLNPANNAANAGGYNGSGTTAGGNPANSSAEYALLSRLIGPQIGMDSAEVPGWGALLVAPLYRGAEVTVR